MSSLRRGEVRFKVYPNDHYPVHVHAEIGSAEIIIALLPDRVVELAPRPNAALGATQNEIRKVLATAELSYDDLADLWEKMHS